MSTDKKEDLRPLIRAVMEADEEEAAEQTDAVSAAADRRIEQEMRKKYGARDPAPAPVPPIRWMTGSAVAMAAAAALFFAIPRGGTAPTLPQYAMELAGDNALLGNPQPDSNPKVARFSEESFFKASVRPNQPVKAKLAFRILRGNDRNYELWRASGTFADEGTLQVQGRMSDLPKLPLGSSRLLFVICAKQKLPDDQSLLRAATAAGPNSLPTFGPSCQVADQLIEMQQSVK